jgi:hypothetical protein
VSWRSDSRQDIFVLSRRRADSQVVIGELEATRTFDVIARPATEQEARALLQDAADLVVVIPTSPTFSPAFVARRRKCLEMQGLRPRLTQVYQTYIEETDGSITQQIQAFPASQ